MILATNCAVLLCLLLFDIAYCKTFNIDRLVRLPRQTKSCSDYEFQCNSGDCVSDILVCDGKEDCRDGSDELNCDKIPCPAYAFRCNYGACINKNLICDGKKDCKDNSDETNARCEQNTTTPANTCADFQYRCSTGQCIKEDSVCDGKADCADQSDETQNICSSLRCAPFNFRCAYGACINGKEKCDGKLDCIDGSDELPTLCNRIAVVTPGSDVVTPTNAPPGEGCTVPQYPANGRYNIFGLNTPILPGNRVTRGTAVEIICDDRYKTVPNIDFVICKGTKWSNTFPQCHITCTTIKETESTYANCTYKNNHVSCDAPVYGTRAKFTCKDLYEDLNSVSNPNRVCGDDGTWDDRFPNCIPRCGRKSVDAQPLIVGGKKVRKGDYPWQAAIYDKTKNNRNICGGTLISMKTVVSAAHCFAKNNRGNALNPPNRYKIGVGKYYLGFSDPRDAMAQYSEIKRVVVPTRYTGRTNQYSFDVAVVILEQKVELSIVVQPICVDWKNTLEAEQLRPNSFGVVIGWGLTASGGNQSEELKELSVPYVPDGECLQNLREDFKTYFTVDKMCSGYLQNGSSACEGDSGGGLAFPSRDNRYYLRGIVSVAPKAALGSCDADEYTLYTKVSQHIDFISEVDSLAKSL